MEAPRSSREKLASAVLSYKVFLSDLSSSFLEAQKNANACPATSSPRTGFSTHPAHQDLIRLKYPVISLQPEPQISLPSTMESTLVSSNPDS